MQYIEYHIQKKDQGKEVLAILRLELGLSTKKIRSVKWDEEGIFLDGRRVTVRQKVCEGQILKVLKNDSENRQQRILPTPMPLHILYEDEDFLFINKPSGIVSHPSKGHREDSLANGIQAYFNQKKERSSIHLLGRLDKDTSGILGIAKNGVVARLMRKNAKGGRDDRLMPKTTKDSTADHLISEIGDDSKIRKEYLAIAKGHFPEKKGVIDIPMEEYRDPADGLLKMRRSGNPEKGRAKTEYEVIRSYREGYSLLKVRIETGRMHQIRFHMARIGHPLLGDAMYGHGNSMGMTRTALHAYRLTFIHPFTGKEIVLEADLPEDMEKLL